MGSAEHGELLSRLRGELARRAALTPERLATERQRLLARWDRASDAPRSMRLTVLRPALVGIGVAALALAVWRWSPEAPPPARVVEPPRPIAGLWTLAALGAGTGTPRVTGGQGAKIVSGQLAFWIGPRARFAVAEDRRIVVERGRLLGRLDALGLRIGAPGTRVEIVGREAVLALAARPERLVVRVHEGTIELRRAAEIWTLGSGEELRIDREVTRRGFGEVERLGDLLIAEGTATLGGPSLPRLTRPIRDELEAATRPLVLPRSAPRPRAPPSVVAPQADAGSSPPEHLVRDGLSEAEAGDLGAGRRALETYFEQAPGSRYWDRVADAIGDGDETFFPR